MDARNTTQNSTSLHPLPHHSGLFFYVIPGPDPESNSPNPQTRITTGQKPHKHPNPFIIIVRNATNENNPYFPAFRPFPSFCKFWSENTTQTRIATS